jgi:2-polyprenyl-6-hydroxyphenyl methylase/3-demethylubiquinone-9 3-methyltransferase
MKEKKISQESVILDVGCADGSLIARLKEEGFHNVAGCDLGKQPSRNGFEYKTINIDKGGLSVYEDQSFDIIISSDVLEHIENVALTLREFVRILRPHGNIFLTLPNCWNLFERIYFLLTGNSNRYPSERTAGRGAHISMLTPNILESLADRASLKLSGMKGCYIAFGQHMWGKNPCHPTLSYNLLYHYILSDTPVTNRVGVYD